MEKKQVAFEDPFSLVGLTIITVTRTRVYAFGEGRSSMILGSKEPLYVLIKTPATRYKVFDIEGEEKQLDEIKDKFPELKPDLDRISADESY
jgi:hypothetical protein